MEALAETKSIYLLTNQLSLTGNDTLEELLSFIDNNSIFGIDTETTGWFDFKNEVITLQIGNFHTQWIVTDFRPVILDILTDRLFNNPDKLKIFHNAKFDLKFLKKMGIKVVNIYDTLLAEMVLNAGLEDVGYSLQEVALRYLQVYLNKEIRGAIHKEALSQRVLEYAANDVKYLGKIRELQIEKDRSLIPTINLENEAALVFTDIEYNGIKVNREEWLKIDAEIDKELEKVYQNICTIIFDKFSLPNPYWYVDLDLFEGAVKKLRINLNSPLQVIVLLKEFVPKIADTSERSRSRYKHISIIKEFGEYVRFNKLKKAFSSKLLDNVNPITGRIHPEFMQILATGRVSCKNPNLQQIPARSGIGKQMRNAIQSEEGYYIVKGDYAQCELRILAALSKEESWLNAFKNGTDLHTEFAERLFGVKDVKQPTTFNPNITYRDIQKSINFGLAYGMSEFKLSDIMNIDKKKAKSIIDKFFSEVPNIKKFLSRCSSFGVKNSYIYTRLGRKRFFSFDPTDFSAVSEVGRQSTNMPIQGTNADITKLALVRLREYIEEHNVPVKIILQVHDEIVTECAEQYVSEWQVIMKQIMEESALQYIPEVPIPADISVGKTWAK